MLHIKAWFRQAKRVCGSVQFGSLWYGVFQFVSLSCYTVQLLQRQHQNTRKKTKIEQNAINSCHVLQFHVLHFDVLQFHALQCWWSVIFMSVIFSAPPPSWDTKDVKGLEVLWPSIFCEPLSTTRDTVCWASALVPDIFLVSNAADARSNDCNICCTSSVSRRWCRACDSVAVSNAKKILLQHDRTTIREFHQ